MSNPNVIAERGPSTAVERASILKRIAFSIALSTGCVDSNPNPSTSGPDGSTTMAAPTSGPSTTEVDATTDTGMATGSSSTGMMGSMSGDSMGTSGTDTGTTSVDPTTTGDSTDTGVMTNVDPTMVTGADCMANQECGVAGKCVDDKCQCNEGAILTPEMGCVDNGCDPNPCDFGDCNINENDGTAQCIIPIPVITNLNPGCDGPEKNICITGNQTIGSFDVTNAKSCTVQGVNGAIDPGQINSIVNDHAEFNYTAPIPDDEITVICKGPGGFSDPAEVKVTTP